MVLAMLAALVVGYAVVIVLWRRVSALKVGEAERRVREWCARRDYRVMVRSDYVWGTCEVIVRPKSAALVWGQGGFVFSSWRAADEAMR